MSITTDPIRDEIEYEREIASREAVLDTEADEVWATGSLGDLDRFFAERGGYHRALYPAT
jgi:hypothetical protein